MLGEWVTGEVHWSLGSQQIRSESHSSYQSIKLYGGCADLITAPLTKPPIYTAGWDLGYNTWGNSNAESWMAILNGNLIVEICNMCPQVRSQSRLVAFLEWLLWQRKPHTRINDVLTKIPLNTFLGLLPQSYLALWHFTGGPPEGGGSWLTFYIQQKVKLKGSKCKEMQWRGSRPCRVGKKREEGNDEDASELNLPVCPFFSSKGTMSSKKKFTLGIAQILLFPPKKVGPFKGPTFLE